MFTNKDIEHRTIFVINCIKSRNLRVSNGELLLEDADERKTLTKMPFQKILVLFIIGHIHITTPLIEKCKKFNVAIIVMKPSLRPIFYWSDSAEANSLVRNKQHLFSNDDTSIAHWIVRNKISNQLSLLSKTRRTDELTITAKEACNNALFQWIAEAKSHDSLMDIEGFVSKMFFAAYYQDIGWDCRRPRTKCDELNTTLDMGYTILFNFIECFVRMFGFDIYIGVYHRQWFKEAV